MYLTCLIYPNSVFITDELESAVKLGKLINFVNANRRVGPTDAGASVPALTDAHFNMWHANMFLFFLFH